MNEDEKKENELRIALLKAHQDRVDRERQEYETRERNGENIYLDFCIWCNAFKEMKGKNSDTTFAEYLKKENITLSFWQRKHIAEQYFGYQFTFDSNAKKWNICKAK